MSRWRSLVRRVDRILGLTERLLERRVAEPPSPEIFERHDAFRWEASRGAGRLAAIAAPERFEIDDLVGVDRPLARLLRNTEQFVRGLPSNHVLLFGERGTGKSSAVKGLLTRFAGLGLRMVEIDRDDLLHLGRVLDCLRDAPFRFLLFCDDLSFAEGEPGYRELKAALEGRLAGPAANVRIIATSNRRHLLPEHASDNAAAHLDDRGELHLGEALEEKLALSDRFGLLLGFYGFDQATYLSIVDRYVAKAGIEIPVEDLHGRALRWALERSSRSGRTAKQFVDDLAGQLALESEHR